MAQGINNNQNIYQQTNFTNLPQNQANSAAPQMQGGSDNANPILGDSPAGHLAGSQYDSFMPVPKTKQDWINFAKCAGLIGAMSMAVNTFANQSCKRGWLEAWGTKIDTIVDKSPESVKTASKKIVSTLSNLWQKGPAKTRIMQALHTPAKPQVEMVKSQAKGMYGSAFEDLIGALEKESTSPEIKTLITYAKANPKDKESIKKLLDALKDGLDKHKTVIMGEDWHIPFTEKSIPKPTFLKRKVNLSEAITKLECLSEKGLAKSTLGRFVQKGFLTMSEAIGQGVLGGKMGVIFNTLMIAMFARRAFEADKGDKVPTFMEEMTQNAAYFVMAPVGIALAYKAGGLNYLGYKALKDKDLPAELKSELQGKSAVEQYRTILNHLNTKLEDGKIEKYGTEHRNLLDKLAQISDPVKFAKKEMKAGKMTKEAFNAFKKEAKVPLWQKPFKLFGKFLTTGLETPIVGKGPIETLKGLFKHPLETGTDLKNFFKRGAGWPIRFIAVMFIAMPFLTNALTRFSHLIFGKPKHSSLDSDDSSTDKKAEQTKQAPTVAQKPKVQQPSAASAPASANNSLINDYFNKNAQTTSQTSVSQPQNAPTAPPTSTSAATPAATSATQQAPAQPRYIPSSAPFVSKSSTPQVSKYDQLNTKADNAAKNAEDVLANLNKKSG